MDPTKIQALVDMDPTVGSALISPVAKSIMAAHGLALDIDVVLCGMHKARYECGHLPQITPQMRVESREWLQARGYTRMGGLPWDAPCWGGAAWDVPPV